MGNKLRNAKYKIQTTIQKDCSHILLSTFNIMYINAMKLTKYEGIVFECLTFVLTCSRIVKPMLYLEQYFAQK